VSQTVQGGRTRAPFADYAPTAGVYDEAFCESGVPRPEYAALLGDLADVDLARLAAAVANSLSARGVQFKTAHGLLPFTVDPIPRVVSDDEWRLLEAGLVQRARALNAFIADVYGARSIIAAGEMPARVLEEIPHHETKLAGIQPPGGIYAHVAGIDLVRAEDGRFLVLEDNLRTPSGVTYAMAARAALEECLPVAPPTLRSTSQAVELLSETLRGAAPAGVDEPSIVLLSDGPQNSAWYEHQVLARGLGVPLVTLADLDSRNGRLRARIDGALRPVDVVYRRTDEDRLRTDDGRPTALAQALLEPCRRGTLACVNGFGAGIGDDKLVHVYVEAMVRFYLGEEPRLRSVPSYDLAEPTALATALDRLDALVIKPRSGSGGYGIVVCAHANRHDRQRIATAIQRSPERFVAQELVIFSQHPTVCDGLLEPRHVDLRPYVYSRPDQVSVLPGGLTRVAFDPGSLVVNSSQNGGGKDTWVLA